MKIRAVILFLALVLLLALPAAFAAPAPPTDKTPVSHTVSIGSTSSIFVDEGAPTSNFNVLSEQILTVGRDEFGYQKQGLIRFYPILEADGGLLPEDAEISSAHIRLYKTGKGTGTVNVYRLSAGFNESTVTWNTKPGVASTTAVGTASLPSNAGWYNINIPVSLVKAWLTSTAYNHGIALCPDWTDASRSISFYSDESSAYPPALVITYTGSAPDTPTAPPDTKDTTPCTLSYSVSPENPRAGESMTISVHATDNQALSHVTIMRGTTVLARQEAASGNVKSLVVSFTETAVLPAMNYTLIADDIAAPLPVRQDISVPVTGSGSAPVVTITAEWLDVRTVVPERYRLIAGDGQTVRLTAEASDPDGIERLSVMINGIMHEYTFNGETHVSRTFSWTNDDDTETGFTYYASAIDSENLYASTPHESYDIARREDIRLYWDSAPSFNNWSQATLPWDMMVRIFGADECYWVEDWNWKDPMAFCFYNAFIKKAADNGVCFGMSTLSAEIHNGRISPSSLEFPLATHQLSALNSYTKEYILARQAGQYGRDIFLERMTQYPESNNSSNTGVLLDRIRADLERGKPGIVSIREDGSGHALVPWMIRRMNDGAIRLYVYDCNKVSGIHNPAGDILNSAQYPYIDIRSDGNWSYAFSSGKTWNDRLFYFSYEDVLGNSHQLNKLADDAGAPSVTDHNMHTITETVCAFVFGDTDVYFEDDQGRVTGMINGQLKEEIPGSMAVISLMGGEFSDYEAYILPDDVNLSACVTGLGRSEFMFGMFSESGVFAVEGKDIGAGEEDRLRCVPRSVGGIGHMFTFTAGSKDNDFSIRMSAELAGSVQALGVDFIGREYFLEHMGMDSGDSLSLYIEDDASGLVAASETGGVVFDAVFRSTESVDHADRLQTDIPSSRRARISTGSKKTVKLEPENWATGEEDGAVVIEELGYDPGSASAWAVSEIEQAIAYGLTTDGILNDFQQNITRREFCEISVKLYEKLTGNTAAPVSPNPFTDTSNSEVLKAYNLGIVKGVAADRFAPNQPITRQEICVMLMRALRAAIPSLNTNVTRPAAFADESQIAEWAIDAVRFMNSKDIMKGVGNNTINPLGNTTREQAIALVKRTYEAFR